MKRIRWNARWSPAANARVQLPKVASLFLEEGRKAALAESAVEDLHRFRLRVKAWRYTLELFRPFYRPGLEQRLAELRRMQDILGALNDDCTILEMVRKGLEKDSALRRKLEGLLEARVRRKVREFKKYWSQVFDKPGREDLWKRYLQQPKN